MNRDASRFAVSVLKPGASRNTPEHQKFVYKDKKRIKGSTPKQPLTSISCGLNLGRVFPCWFFTIVSQLPVRDYVIASYMKVRQSSSTPCIQERIILSSLAVLYCTESEAVLPTPLLGYFFVCFSNVIF